jgi:hypothetical protein
MSVYGNVGYIADNGGSVLCIDLSTLAPLWYRANTDDTDATPVVSIENDTPFIYVGCEVDKQGDSGIAYMRKISGLTGHIEIRCTSSMEECYRHRYLEGASRQILSLQRFVVINKAPVEY